MQLLKLVYIAHGWSLGLIGRPLISDRIEAWQYGPVIPELYRTIRRFKSSPVIGPIAGTEKCLTGSEKNLIRQTYDIYGRLSGPSLSRLTHQKGSPWDNTYIKGSFGLPISNDLIEDHYGEMAARTDLRK